MACENHSDECCCETGGECRHGESESCDCERCGGGCRSEAEEAAAAAYRDAHAGDAVPEAAGDFDPFAPDAPAFEHVIVVSFSSTFDVMEAERLCLEAGVPGRIRPLPASIKAECGLAWIMPCSGEALAAFRAAVEGAVIPEDYRQLMLEKR